MVFSGVSHPRSNSQLFEKYKKYLDKKIFDNKVNKIFLYILAGLKR